jgi:hypothetical protein
MKFFTVVDFTGVVRAPIERDKKSARGAIPKLSPV